MCPAASHNNNLRWLNTHINNDVVDEYIVAESAYISHCVHVTQICPWPFPPLWWKQTNREYIHSRCKVTQTQMQFFCPSLRALRDNFFPKTVSPAAPSRSAAQFTWFFSPPLTLFFFSLPDPLYLYQLSLCLVPCHGLNSETSFLSISLWSHEKKKRKRKEAANKSKFCWRDVSHLFL